MTGVGLAAGSTEVGELRVEVRSVNGRALSTKLRLPAALGGYEAALDELLRQRLQRGTVTLVVERAQSGGALPDAESVRRVAAEMAALADELRLAPPSLAEVLAVVGSQRGGDAVTSRPLSPKLAAVAAAAIDELLRCREHEGRAIVAACLDTLAQYEQQFGIARERAPLLAERYRERLLVRVQEFLAAHAPETSPVADVVREVAIYADRIDVAEELQRIDTHLAEIRRTLAGGGEVGRRLEFLLQELLRETNTMGSKSPDAAMTHAVVAMKSCIDRLKEQAANLE